MLDTKALTGESVPRSIRKGDEALSGCINQSGLLTLKVTKSFGESTVSKITDLVENASARKAPTENFITTFARYYTPVVVGMAAVLAIIPPLVLGGGWSEWLRRGFVFLIVSCPCALVISIPLTFFGGIGAASKRGVLVKGSNYLEALNKVSVVVFDKTGTLTKGVFGVANIIPAAGYQKEQVLEYAAQAESYSNHPIAKSILATYGKPIDQKQFSGFEEISGHGISVMVQGKKVLAGNSKLMESEKIAYAACDAVGTKFYVAADGSYVGCILIADEVKPDSKCAIAELKKIGVEKLLCLPAMMSESASRWQTNLVWMRIMHSSCPARRSKSWKCWISRNGRAANSPSWAMASTMPLFLPVQMSALPWEVLARMPRLKLRMLF